MKKIIFIILFIFICIPFFGQDLRFSFMANPQFSWHSFDSESIERKGMVVGLNTGIEMDIFFAEKYAFSTGLTISNKGGKLSYSDTVSFTTSDGNVLIPANKTITTRYQYLTIPFGLKFKTLEIGYSTYWINVGLTPMVNIKARGTDEDQQMEKANLIDDTNIFNINYFIEAGIEYSLGGNTAIIAGAGYNSGFLDISKNTNDRIFTNSFSLVVGVLF